MNNKEKEIFKKLLKIASNQQKIIQKLAESTDVDPWKYDPAGPNHDFSITKEIDYDDPKAQEKAKERVSKNFPWLDKSNFPKSTAPVAPAPAVYLQQDVKSALDNSPFKDKLKNNLMLNVNGTSVDVRYNLDKLNVKPETLQKHLQSLMPSFTVNPPVGASGNLNVAKDWHPNY